MLSTTATESWSRQWSSLGTQSAKHLIQRPAQLKIAGSLLTPPHASTEKQLFIALFPAFSLEHTAEGIIIQSCEQRRRTPLLMNPREYPRQRLIQSRIPGEIAKQFKGFPSSSLRQPKTTSENGIALHQHAAT